MVLYSTLGTKQTETMKRYRSDKLYVHRNMEIKSSFCESLVIKLG